MNVHITPHGFRLAVLEGAHAEECRTQARLREQMQRLARELYELRNRMNVSEEIRTRIEKEMDLILDERKAA